MDTFPVTLSLPTKLFQGLTEVAYDKGLSLDELILATLKDYLNKERRSVVNLDQELDACRAKPARAANSSAKPSDKREYPRTPLQSDVQVALELDKENVIVHNLGMLNISLGGSLLVIPKDEGKVVELIGPGQHFKIVITVTDDDKLSINCQARRVEVEENKALVGASFEPYDYCDMIKIFKLMKDPL